MKASLLVINDNSCAAPFAALQTKYKLQLSYDPKLLFSEPERVALVVFTGGEDVSPNVYKSSPHPRTYNNPSRDAQEIALFRATLRHQIPKAGICRGAQFLCAMAGGKLVQDITGHMSDHVLTIKAASGTREVLVNSSHHQMQYPFTIEPSDYEVIGWSPAPRSRYYAFDANRSVDAETADAQLRSEPDIVYYNKLQALASQYHPEWLPKTHQGFKLYEELVDTYLEPAITARLHRMSA